MASLCISASEIGTLAFTDDFTTDRQNRKNAVGYRRILCPQIQPNDSKFIGRHFVIQQVSHPELTTKAKSLSERLNNKQELKVAAVKA